MYRSSNLHSRVRHHVNFDTSTKEFKKTVIYIIPASCSTLSQISLPFSPPSSTCIFPSLLSFYLCKCSYLLLSIFNLPLQLFILPFSQVAAVFFDFIGVYIPCCQYIYHHGAVNPLNISVAALPLFAAPRPRSSQLWRFQRGSWTEGPEICCR